MTTIATPAARELISSVKAVSGAIQPTEEQLQAILRDLGLPEDFCNASVGTGLMT